jgi:hypothetical protein
MSFPLKIGLQRGRIIPAASPDGQADPTPFRPWAGATIQSFFFVLFPPFPVGFFPQTDMAPGIDAIPIDYK